MVFPRAAPSPPFSTWWRWWREQVAQVLVAAAAAAEPLVDSGQWRETVEQEAARQRLLDQARRNGRWPA